ncbi:helix-turn-helix domain-containing protein [Exilibacterium tricleocarpae]|uniref:helix-turn-helix domain-containing protein n=1 Tax=Exilibacterium tricleocarpae TaxID=2591008 RepID=UPI0015D2F96E|nr:AraC family transcriptional regulator [Exilibacterium tricleocarpae]
MTKVIGGKTVVDSVSYERLVPGRLKTSSRQKSWDGFHFMSVNYPRHCTGSPRPATTDHSLIFADSGAARGEYRLNSSKWKKFTWHAGAFFIAPALENDRDIRWDAITPQHVDLSVCYMNISPGLLAKSALEVADKGPYKIELPHQLGLVDPFMRQLGEKIKKEVDRGSPFGTIFVETAVSLLSVYLLQEYCSVTYKVPEYRCSLSTSKLRLLFDYIHSHLDREISLNVLAGLVHMSTYHFARLFKDTVGLPPHKYVMQQRIEKAKRLLRSTDMPVSLVALEVGYTNSNFFHTFKKVTGHTPNTFRKQPSSPRIRR